jgi:hypothetical protein
MRRRYRHTATARPCVEGSNACGGLPTQRQRYSSRFVRTVLQVQQNSTPILPRSMPGSSSWLRRQGFVALRHISRTCRLTGNGHCGYGSKIELVGFSSKPHWIQGATSRVANWGTHGSDDGWKRGRSFERLRASANHDFGSLLPQQQASGPAHTFLDAHLSARRLGVAWE